MTKIEELKYLIELLKKHDLPISPILEYSIKEREKQYFDEANRIALVRNQEPAFEIYKDLEDYCHEFSNLSVGAAKGKKLPHKALLLMAIMHLIETNAIIENRIELDKTIATAFADCWRKYYDDIKVPSVWIPFWYLKSESFWHFKSSGNEELLQGLLDFAGHPSVGQMRSVIKYAYLDEALWNHLQEKNNREYLKAILEKTYI